MLYSIMYPVYNYILINYVCTLWMYYSLHSYSTVLFIIPSTYNNNVYSKIEAHTVTPKPRLS